LAIDVVVRESGAALIDTVRVAFAIALAESLTVKVRLVLPVAVGVPEIAPAEESWRPAGSVPAESVKV
jgi:hypothetical protein